MRRANYAGALQYVPELSWILFLRILDEREELEAEEADGRRGSLLAVARGAVPLARLGGARRREARRADRRRDGRRTWRFVNGDLLPHLRGLRDAAGASAAPEGDQPGRVSAVDKVDVDTERNLLDILDRVHEIQLEAVDQTHVFTLSQAYEGLLLKMGEKNNDGGQFFTPREVIRAMVRAGRPEGRRDDLRPRLRDGRLPRPGVRPHARRAWAPDATADAAPDPPRGRRSGAARRPTSSTRSRSRTSSCTASTSRTSGTATR